MTEHFITRRAPLAAFAPSSFDAERRTVDAVVSTGADVARRDKNGAYVERLDLDAINPADLVGIAVQLDHDHSTRASVGKVIAASRTVAGLTATIQLSGAADVAPIIERIADGTLSAVSVGYSVQAWAESREGAKRLRTATTWRIHEVSLVAIPADPHARIRNMHMENEDLIEAPTVEQTRAEIRTIARSAGLSAEDADSMIDRGLSPVEARAEAFEALQNRSRNTPRIRVIGSSEDPATIVTRASDALAHRMGAGELPDASREYASMSFLDLARDSLTRAGISVRGLSADEVFTRASHGTSDFPLVVSNATGKVALESYKAAESPLKQLARQRTLPDFKASTSIRAGGMGRLEPLSEHGEITATSRAETGETLQLGTFARRFDVTRKLMINDDAGVLGDTVAALGQAAAQTEADVMVSLLLDNPNMSDGTAVFHTSRGNLASPGTALDETNLAAARLAMRQRKDLDGVTLISATPKFLVVGPENETGAEKLLSTIYAATTDDANVFAGKLTLLVEPRLDEGQWFVFADPARLAGMQYAYLSGAPGVQIQRHEEWNTLGMSWRAYLDFGAAWVDWRGAQMNPGT